jgi:hypothetical protein
MIHTLFRLVTRSKRAIFLVLILALSNLALVSIDKSFADVTVSSPIAVNINLNADNNISNVSVSGLASDKIYLTSIALVNGPSGGYLKITDTSTVTISYGYDSRTVLNNFSEVSFTGTATQVNTALASLKYHAGATAGSPQIRITATENEPGLAYYSTTGHYYKVGHFMRTVGDTPTASNNYLDDGIFCSDNPNGSYGGTTAAVNYKNNYSSIQTLETRTMGSANCTWSEANRLSRNSVIKGRPGYLANITTQGENDFLKDKVQGALNAWIGGSDGGSDGSHQITEASFSGFSYLSNSNLPNTFSGGTEGLWHFFDGPEKGQIFWRYLGGYPSTNCGLNMVGQSYNPINTHAKWQTYRGIWERCGHNVGTVTSTNTSNANKNDAVGYTNWANTGEPNNASSSFTQNGSTGQQGEDNIVFNWVSANGGWNDLNGSEPTVPYFGYIIEYGDATAFTGTVTNTINLNTIESDCSGAGFIQNGSFEQLTGTTSSLTGGYSGTAGSDSTQIPTGWKTTALATSNSKAVIETWGGLSESPTVTNISSPSNAYSYRGSAIAEIAADNGGDSSPPTARQGLYQDVNTISGSRIFWSYWHHYRSGGPNENAQVSLFRAAPTPSGTPSGSIWTGTEQQSPFGSGGTPITSVYDTVTSTSAWQQSTGTFLATSASTRFLFSNYASPASGYGNLIDDVRFTVFRACPITVKIIEGRTSTFNVKNNEQDGNSYLYLAPSGSTLSSVYSIPSGLNLSISSSNNSGSVLSISSSTRGIATASYQISYTFGGTTYTSSSTISVEVLPEITLKAPTIVPITPNISSKNLPGLKFASATNGYVCIEQVADSGGSSISTPTFSISQDSFASGIQNVQSGAVTIDSGTVSSLSSQSSRIKLSAIQNFLGTGGSKYLRIRASSIDNTDGMAPSCSNGVSVVIEFRRIGLTQTRSFTVLPKNGRQNN